MKKLPFFLVLMTTFLSSGLLTKVNNDNTEFRNRLEKRIEYFEDSWGTPVMMIVQDGKMIDIVEQLVTKDEYIDFLEENEVL